MKSALYALICILAVAVHGQNDKKEQARVLSAPTYYFKAESFIQMSEADRMVYTSGLMDGFFASPLFGARNAAIANLQTCTKDMDSRQVSAIITKYVKEHPETWHLPLSVEAYNALNTACPGGLKVVN